MRIWSRNNSGQLIYTIEAEDMDAAQQLAAHWNKVEKRPEMRIDVIANSEKTSTATKVRAIY